MASQKHILAHATTLPAGLHCINLENGEELWWFDPDGNALGATPAVDQSNNLIYFQARNRLWKINALNGALLDFVTVTDPNNFQCGNTVLVDDGHGYFIAVQYNDWKANGGAVKVYDINLDLVWEVKDLNLNLKTVLAYYDGVIYVGFGNNFNYPDVVEWYSGGLENAGVKAYDITDGTLLWTYICDEDAEWEAYGRGVIDVIYCNGYVVFNTHRDNAEIYILDASDGSLVKKWEGDFGKADACAPAALSGGRLYWGSLQDNKIICVQIGIGDYKDWNTFGSTPQLNHNVAHEDSLQSIADTPVLVGMITGGNQGGIIIDSVGYFLNETLNTVKFNATTLAIINNFASGNIYDSTPLMIKNLADNDVLLIKESLNARVIAINPETGDRLWNSEGNIAGNLFFGMNYYESAFVQMINGMTSAEYISALNDNFTSLNALVGDAASLTTITDELIGQDLLDAINGNVAALNAEIDPPVDWTDIELGETGLSANTKLNEFNTAFKLAV